MDISNNSAVPAGLSLGGQKYRKKTIPAPKI
jgi:hypothetical protein